MNLDKIKIGDKCPDEFNVIIEIPSGGAPVKYEIDKDSGALVVDRFVATPMFYPFHYGFVPHTLASDGDPLDVLLLADFPIYPGSVIKVRPIGMLNMEDESGGDEKILCVPVDKIDSTHKNVSSYEDLPEIVIKRIIHFFEHYKDLEKGKWVKLGSLVGIKDAKDCVLKSIANYKG
jgi:inorganic pyrophosphatase